MSIPQASFTESGKGFCPICDGVADRVVDTSPTPYECSQCGARGFVVGDLSFDWTTDPHRIAPCQVTVIWRNGTPSAAEVAAVRKLLPAYADLSPSDCLTQLSEMDGNLLMSELPRWKAEQLVKRGTELGLICELTDS